MSKPIQTGHGHGHNDATGAGHHDSSETTANSPGLSTIGNPFTPMVHTAPVHGMSAAHEKLSCSACGARTYHTLHLPIPRCASCHGPLAA